MPIIRKRRLTFEESLIAGTCISTTSSPAVTTDAVKMSTKIPSGAGSKIVHSLEDTVQTVAKLTADTKATSVPKPSDKKEFTTNDTKKVKLEDEKSVPVQHVSGTKTASDEVKIRQRSSDTVNEGSLHAKLSSNLIPVHAESKSSKSAVLHSEIKCDNKSDHISDDSKSGCMKTDGADLVVSKDDVGIKNNLVGTGVVTVADEAPVKLAKQSASDRTSRHNHHHHHHQDRHHHRHSSSSTKPHRMSGSHLDYELRQTRHSGSKYGSLMHVETDPNGGASVLHAFEDELSTLSPRELTEFVQEFFRVVFDEDPVGVPRYVIGIVHNSAAFLPDIIEYFASARPDMIVKRNILGKSLDVETTTIGEYYERVQSTYLAGTYRTGPLNHFSIVGTKAEETGGYFPEFLDLLDQNEFLKNVSPWGKLSELENMPRNESNDGPIVWARPGEQVVPTADLPKSPMVKKR